MNNEQLSTVNSQLKKANGLLAFSVGQRPTACRRLNNYAIKQLRD